MEINYNWKSTNAYQSSTSTGLIKIKMSRELSKTLTTITDSLYKLADDTAAISYYNDIKLALVVEEKVTTIQEKLQDIEAKTKTYIAHEKILGTEPFDKAPLDKVREVLSIRSYSSKFIIGI
jgi:hypothetical protein